MCHLTCSTADSTAPAWQKIELQRGGEDGNGMFACPWISVVHFTLICTPHRAGFCIQQSCTVLYGQFKRFSRVVLTLLVFCFTQWL